MRAVARTTLAVVGYVIGTGLGVAILYPQMFKLVRWLGF